MEDDHGREQKNKDWYNESTAGADASVEALNLYDTKLLGSIAIKFGNLFDNSFASISTFFPILCNIYVPIIIYAYNYYL